MSALGTVAGVFRPGPVERLTFDLSYEPDRVRAWALGQSLLGEVLYDLAGLVGE